MDLFVSPSVHPAGQFETTLFSFDSFLSQCPNVVTVKVINLAQTSMADSFLERQAELAVSCLHEHHGETSGVACPPLRVGYDLGTNS